MPWVRLDDHFAEHPKVVDAGPLALAMHVAGLCYSSRNLTDGYVPRSVAKTLLDFEGIAFVWQGDTVGGGSEVEWHHVVSDLVDAGLWTETEGGWTIHDYLEYQPSRDEVMARRSELSEKRARAGRKGAQTRWQTDGKPDGKRESESPGRDSKHGKPDGKPDSKEYGKPMAGRWQDDGPDPDPIPDPLREEKNAPAGAEPETDEALPAVVDLDSTGLTAEATRDRNPWWDALVDLFGQPTHPQRSLYGRMAKTAQQTGPPSEIRRRAEHIALTWGADKLTVASLEKHWNRADSAVGQVGDIDLDAARLAAEREAFRRTGDAELARRKAQQAARMRGTR